MPILRLPAFRRAKEKPTSANECEVLKWAAGATIQVSEDAAIEEDKLFALIGQHRLAARFLSRWEQERPVWCSRSLVTRLLEQHAQARIRLQRQLRALREISATIDSKRQPLVTIKGFSTYALTGHSRNLRYSSDLDLFYGDLEYLRETLLRLGYTGEIGQGHEFAQMCRDDIMLELHRYVMVWSYPAGVASTNLALERNPGHWIQNFAQSPQKHIQYDDLIVHLSSGLGAETSGLSVPDPSMSVLIICAHEFREFIGRPWRRRSKIKLAVLADVYDLIQHPQFDSQRFLALVDKFEAHHSVQFVSHLLESYFGSNPLPASSSIFQLEEHFKFPQLLTPFGCWAVVNSADEMLLPLNSHTMMDRLGANSVVAATENQPKLYTVQAECHGEAIQRAIIQAARDADLPFQFSLDWNENGLSFDVSILESLKPECVYSVRILFYENTEIYQEISISGQGTQLKQSGQGVVSMSLHYEGCRLQVLFSRKVLPNHLSASKPLTLLVGRWDDDASLSQDAGFVTIMMPLNIVRQ